MGFGDPTQRSLTHLRAAGYHCEIVEQFVRFPSGHRKDLWGWCDIIVVRPGEVWQQTTTKGKRQRTRSKDRRQRYSRQVREAGVRNRRAWVAWKNTCREGSQVDA